MTTVEDITRAQVLTLFSRCGNDVPTLLRTVGRCLQEIGRTDVRVEADNNGTFVCVSQNAAYAKRTSVFQQQVEGLAAQAKATVASFKQAPPYPTPQSTTTASALGGAVRPTGVPPLVGAPAAPSLVSAPLPTSIVGSLTSPVANAPALYTSNIGVPALASQQFSQPPPAVSAMTVVASAPPPAASIVTAGSSPQLPAAVASAAVPSYFSSPAPAPAAQAASTTSLANPPMGQKLLSTAATVPTSVTAPSSTTAVASPSQQKKRSSSAKPKCFPAENQRDYPTSNYNGNYQLRRFGGDFPSHCNYGFYRRYGTEGQGAVSAEFHNSPGGGRPNRSHLY